jgi:hypothetical protein
VVTRFTFRLNRIGATLTGGFALWGAERTADVFATYRELIESAPAELSAAAFVARAPQILPDPWPGRPVTGLLVAHTGTDARADLAAVRALRDPIVDLIEEMPYTQLQSLFDDDLPAGHHYYLKSAFLPGLSDGLLDSFGGVARQVAAPPSEAVLVHIGGRLNELDEDDGVVGNRDAR